ncbi:NmrA-like family protein [Pestalotiopsis sp. NC0098]|nr:NmrA-like family protein [Pestalotiopsis sp. NC0098]
MSPASIIIFGPTGQIAAAAAQAALEKGVKVSLAMRDTAKQIPGLEPQLEKSAGVERVYADLSLPDTVRAAVAQTGAKRAFLYCIFGKPLRPSIEALKESGIEFVVFNSSSSITVDPRAVEKATNYIAWEHAQVEIALEEVFGVPNYVTVRPAYFMSNVLSWKEMVKKGELKIVYPEAYFNYIAPEDIGAVCGSLLAAGPQVLETKAGRNIVFLYGSDLLSQREAGQSIGRAVGLELPIETLDHEQGIQFFVEVFHLPKPGATGLVARLKGMSEKGRELPEYQGPVYEEALDHVEKYSGKKPMTLAQWLETHQDQFKA